MESALILFASALICTVLTKAAFACSSGYKALAMIFTLSSPLSIFPFTITGTSPPRYEMLFLFYVIRICICQIFQLLHILFKGMTSDIETYGLFLVTQELAFMPFLNLRKFYCRNGSCPIASHRMKYAYLAVIPVSLQRLRYIHNLIKGCHHLRPLHPHRVKSAAFYKAFYNTSVYFP